MRRMSILLTGALAVAIATPVTPVVAADTGTVTATVTVADDAPCLTVGASAVGYGTLPLSEVGSPSLAKGTPTYDIENCGSNGIDLLVRGTAASGDGGAAWSLTDDNTFQTNCSTLDVFSVDAENSDMFVMLTDTDQVAATVGAGTLSTGISHDLWMPCVGSSGTGQTMSFDIIWTAVAGS